jgi:hypothetical protein
MFSQQTSSSKLTSTAPGKEAPPDKGERAVESERESARERGSERERKRRESACVCVCVCVFVCERAVERER